MSTAGVQIAPRLRSRRGVPWIGSLLLVALLVTFAAGAADPRPLGLRRLSLELPGMPAKIISADLDGDGDRDLFLVVAYTEVESIGADRVEDMVQVTTVIPALFSRREARAYLAEPDGSYRPGGALALDESVLAIDEGFGGTPLFALTDRGVASIRFDEATDPALRLEPLIELRPVMAGAGSFLSRLQWLVDLDGDGDRDLLFPGEAGPSVHLQTEGRLEPRPVSELKLPGDTSGAGYRQYPLPQVLDVNGDGHPDLLVWGRYWTEREIHLFLGDGAGGFAPAYRGRADCPLGESALRLAAAEGRGSTRFRNVTWVGDIDGDGRAELVTQEQVESEKSGLRAGLKEIRKPRNRFRFHRLGDGFEVEREPFIDVEVEGHPFASAMEISDFLQFADLDGDGRSELITVTLDFSLLGAAKALATKHLKLGLDFHVWAQEAGSFRAVEGLDLSEKLRFDFEKLSLGRFAQFAGDFDGDGRTDFVHFGRGSEITIHRGQPGCRYAAKPDLALTLEEEPADLGLVRVSDYDFDLRSDIAVIVPLEPERQDESPPTRIDLYLSGAP